MAKKFRNSYTSELKLEIIEFADVYGNREASRVYEVDE
jgi:hypothetical protein